MAAFLNLFGLSYAKLIIWSVIAAAAVGFLAYEHHKIYTQGYTTAIADVRAANAKADKLATKGQAQVESCFTSGGTWDRDNGTCSQ